MLLAGAEKARHRDCSVAAFDENIFRAPTGGCPKCDSATTPADYWIENGTLVRVHVAVSNGPLFNVKKQVWVPALGMQVVVQGVVEQVGQERFLEQVRFGDIGHAGPHVHVADVVRGAYPTGSYVWLPF